MCILAVLQLRNGSLNSSRPRNKLECMADWVSEDSAIAGHFHGQCEPQARLWVGQSVEMAMKSSSSPSSRSPRALNWFSTERLRLQFRSCDARPEPARRNHWAIQSASDSLHKSEQAEQTIPQMFTHESHGGCAPFGPSSTCCPDTKHPPLTQ